MIFNHYICGKMIQKAIDKFILLLANRLNIS